MKDSNKLSTYQRIVKCFKILMLLFFISLLSVFFVNAQPVEDTIQVGAGWNMIGSIYSGVVSDIIRSEPPGIIVSQFFGYNPAAGYESTDTLKKGVGYWVKLNDDGLIIYSSPDTVLGTSCPGIPTVEYSGKTYNTVLIGSQCWLKENLDVGTMIIGDSSQTNNGIIQKYCYNNDTSSCNNYGGLYQWDEAMQYTVIEGTQGICPSGWHIPSLAEYEILAVAVDSSADALKAIGEGTGTNTSGFSGLLSGLRDIGPYFSGLGNRGVFWSSTENEYDAQYAYDLLLYEAGIIYFNDGYDKLSGFSVRCLKD